MAGKIDVECVIDGAGGNVTLYDNVGETNLLVISITMDGKEPYIAEQVKLGNHKPLKIWCKLNGYNLVRVVGVGVYSD